MDLVVEGVHCGACIVTIEKGLSGRTGRARRARQSRRASASPSSGTRQAQARPDPRQARSGSAIPPIPSPPPRVDNMEMAEERRLLRCLGVAAFCGDERDAALCRPVGGRGTGTPPVRRAISSIGCPRWSRCPRWPIPGMPFFESAVARACASARSTWTCRSRWGCCSRSIVGRADPAARPDRLFRQRA